VADGKGSGSLGHGLKNEKKTDETAVIREKKKELRSKEHSGGRTARFSFFFL
jgi:hypothetical protein